MGNDCHTKYHKPYFHCSLHFAIRFVWSQYNLYAVFSEDTGTKHNKNVVKLRLSHIFRQRFVFPSTSVAVFEVTVISTQTLHFCNSCRLHLCLLCFICWLTDSIAITYDIVVVDNEPIAVDFTDLKGSCSLECSWGTPSGSGELSYTTTAYVLTYVLHACWIVFQTRCFKWEV